MRYPFLAALILALAAGCEAGERTDSDLRTSGAQSAPGAPEPAPAEVHFYQNERDLGAGAGGAGARAADMATEQGEESRTPPMPDRAAAGDAGQRGGTAVPTMVIRSGRAVVEVDSLEPAVAAVQALALRLGGFVGDISMQTGREQLRSATLRLRIPAERFDDALAGLRPIGKVQTVDVSAEDVGEEFVDISARVSNARRLEDRLVALLASRTGKLEEVLAVERELARVREQIERYEGRLRYLRSRAAVSTLAVTVHEPSPLLGDRPGRNPIADAFRRAWRNFVAVVAGLIASLGFLIPLAILAVLVWLGVRSLSGRGWWRR